MSCTSLYSNHLILCLVHLRKHAYKVLPDEGSSLKKISTLKQEKMFLTFCLIISQDKMLMLNVFIKKKELLFSSLESNKL